MEQCASLTNVLSTVYQAQLFHFGKQPISKWNSLQMIKFERRSTDLACIFSIGTDLMSSLVTVTLLFS